MTFASRWSHRKLFFVLAASYVLPFLMVVSLYTYSNYRFERAKAFELVREAAADAASESEMLLSESRHLLNRFARRPMVATLDPARCDPILRELQQWHRLYGNLSTIDRNGQVICNSLGLDAGQLPSYRSREWFSRVTQSGAFTVGEPVLGGTTGLRVAPLVDPLRDEKGNITGFLSLTVDLSRFRPLPPRALPLPGIEVSVVTSKGNRITHSSERGKVLSWLLQTRVEQDLLNKIRSKPRGGVEHTGGDGVATSYYFESVPGTSWIALASVPTQLLTADARRQALHSFAMWLLVLAVSAVIFGFILSWSQKRLRERDEQTRNIVDIVMDGIISVSPDGTVESANPAALRHFHRDPREVLGCPVGALIIGLQVDRLQQQAGSASPMMVTGAAQSPQTAIAQRADGSAFPVEYSISEFQMSSQPRFVIVFRDISERQLREAQRRARDSERRRAFVREVHHRIKNHIQGIAGLLASNALREPALTPAIRAATAQLQSVAVVHGLQGSAGGHVTLAELVREICITAQNHAADGTRIDFQAASQCRAILREEDAVSVALIINELVTNAMRHQAGLNESRVVTVRTDETGEQVQVQVTNPGVLPADFDWTRIAPQGNGLIIARSLLPAEGAALTIVARGGTVYATLELRAPAITLATPPPSIPND
jgi:PAS domain S-box-containing protein